MVGIDGQPMHHPRKSRMHLTVVTTAQLQTENSLLLYDVAAAFFVD